LLVFKVQRVFHVAVRLKLVNKPMDLSCECCGVVNVVSELVVFGADLNHCIFDFLL